MKTLILTIILVMFAGSAQSQYVGSDDVARANAQRDAQRVQQQQNHTANANAQQQLWAQRAQAQALQAQTYEMQRNSYANVQAQQNIQNGYAAIGSAVGAGIRSIFQHAKERSKARKAEKQLITGLGNHYGLDMRKKENKESMEVAKDKLILTLGSSYGLDMNEQSNQELMVEYALLLSDDDELSVYAARAFLKSNGLVYRD